MSIKNTHNFPQILCLLGANTTSIVKKEAVIRGGLVEEVQLEVVYQITYIFWSARSLEVVS